MPQPLVYVLVLNWNLKDDTAECVTSVLASDYERYRVLVVDNASSDGSPASLQRTFSGLEVVVNSTNLGFAAGNNVGIRRALSEGADYVFLLNNDTIVEATMLSTLVAYANGDTSVGLVAPKILYYQDPNRIWRLGDRVHRWWPVPLSVGCDQVDHGQYLHPLELDYVTFCGVLIRRRLLETIGLLDERFFFTYEDADFCRRAQTAGYRVVCHPRARVWHKVSRSAQMDAANIRYLKSKNRALFYRRYPHGPHPWLTAAYLWSNTLGSAGLSLLCGKSRLAFANLRGLYDGYHERLDGC